MGWNQGKLHIDCNQWSNDLTGQDSSTLEGRHLRHFDYKRLCFQEIIAPSPKFNNQQLEMAPVYAYEHKIQWFHSQSLSKATFADFNEIRFIWYAVSSYHSIDP